MSSGKRKKGMNKIFLCIHIKEERRLLRFRPFDGSDEVMQEKGDSVAAH
jgi:hypothetical protein